jgi:uncharacterized protein YbbC (DUF1343 family)
MRFTTEITARFFSVVGAPYVAESHFDSDCNDAELPGSHRSADLAALPRPCTSVSWLQEDR